jgi:hypothetical protein
VWDVPVAIRLCAHDRAPRMTAASATPVTWSALEPRAKAFRVAHGIWSVFGLGTLAYI